jgi:hypothetical protein
VSDQRNKFEGELKRSFKHKLGDEGTSFRRRQHFGAPQKWDLAAVQKVMLKDFEIPLVSIFEAKSKDVPEEPSKSEKDIYFTGFFNNPEKTTEELIQEFKGFADQTSFEPFFALEKRRSTGSSAYILHYDHVKKILENGEKKIPMDIERLPEETIELIRYPNQKREEEGYPKYKIPDSFFKQLREKIMGRS